jgi:hypothetical protein
MFLYAYIQDARADFVSPKTVKPWLEYYKEFQNVRVHPNKDRAPEMLVRAFYASVDFLGPF